jgi:hypothetical protein
MAARIENVVRITIPHPATDDVQKAFDDVVTAVRDAGLGANVWGTSTTPGVQATHLQLEVGPLPMGQPLPPVVNDATARLIVVAAGLKLADVEVDRAS